MCIRDRYNTPQDEYENYTSCTTKECSKCKKTKLLFNFNGNTSGRDPFDKDGYRLRRPECNECTKKDGEGKQIAKKIAKENNIPFKAPEGTLCAICHNPPKKGDELVFDHDHNKNVFRGYLHNSCNRALGILGDDLKGIINVFNYVNNDNTKVVQNECGKLMTI